ncbi:YwaF family protein [Williamsoniiplasma lucivorax]|uniref:Uncharacterized protein n=1 Tax=Williamsoniiplasma lucivorax TaxID=209274 RepID=A0A2S5REM0_9MOLU|nr:YwaF family protein [Williamsoniiplasma lucivorax]PPE05747.1 hypothetical protein ELUCI_v1c00340 [Williamsoniiplasma lucivorax]
MQHIAEFVIALTAFVGLITSLFVFHKFWAKTTKTIWVRLIIMVWLLISEIWFIVNNQVFEMYILKDGEWIINSKFMYFELCNLLTVTGAILMFMPTKLNLDMLLPLAIIAPIIVLIVPTQESQSWSFANFRYWNYYFGHIGIIFGYLYIYLYDFTGARLSWKSMRRSMAFALFFLTFVMVWNMAFVPNGHNPLDPAPPGSTITDLNNYWGPNYVYKFILYYLGLGTQSLLAQYFLMIFVLGPVIMLVGWTIIYFVRPIYADRGTEKLKYNVKEDILGFKTTFTKANMKQIFQTTIKKIKP